MLRNPRRVDITERVFLNTTIDDTPNGGCQSFIDLRELLAEYLVRHGL